MGTSKIVKGEKRKNFVYNNRLSTNRHPVSRIEQRETACPFSATDNPRPATQNPVSSI
jgi:hypothetical protein